MNDQAQARRAALKRILTEQKIHSQEQLAAELGARGHASTQSSISRDFAELGVEKVAGRYVLRAANEIRILGITAILSAGDHLLVIKTTEGAAQAVAFKLDHLELPEIVGTVAGDDTIFIATADKAGQDAIRKALEGIQ